MHPSLRHHGGRLVAVGVIVGLYAFARLPTLSVTEHADLAASFRFSRATLAGLEGDDLSRTIRRVHPSLERIAGWVSTTGAAVALNDLDGDGLSNDACTSRRGRIGSSSPRFPEPVSVSSPLRSTRTWRATTPRPRPPWAPFRPT